MAEKNWFPLESNPAVMNSYMAKLGLNIENYSFHDVFSTEDWALEMIPQPVVSVLLLYPISTESEAHLESEAKHINENGQTVSSNVRFMKQTISNACGTLALLHSVSNAHEYQGIEFVKPDSYLAHFLENTKEMKPDEIATFLEVDNELEVTHENAATEGQSEQTADVDSHFICFSHVDGNLYELDGRKQFPINHGTTSSSMILEDACKVIKQFMDRQPNEVRFTIIALCKSSPTAEDE